MYGYEIAMNMALPFVHRPLRCHLPGVSPCRLPAAGEWQVAFQGGQISVAVVALVAQADSQQAPRQEWSEPWGCKRTDLHALLRATMSSVASCTLHSKRCPGLSFRPEPWRGVGQVHQLGVVWPCRSRFLSPMWSPGHARSPLRRSAAPWPCLRFQPRSRPSLHHWAWKGRQTKSIRPTHAPSSSAEVDRC